MQERKLWGYALNVRLSGVVVVGLLVLAVGAVCSGSAAGEARTWTVCAGGSAPGSCPSQRALVSALDSTVAQLTVPGIFTCARHVGGSNYSLAEIPGEGWLAVPGKPMVPEVVVLVACPECDDVEITCRVGACTTVDDVVLCPAPREVMLDEGDGSHLAEEFWMDENAYASDAVYPAAAARVLSVGRIRDQKVVWLGVYPVQYNAARRQVSIAAETEITLFYRNPRPSVATRGTGPSRICAAGFWLDTMA